MYSVALNTLGVASQPRFRGATLSLNFANTGALDSRVTFTRNSAATYFNSSGTLTSASANTPRFDYDPVTLAARGLLIEEQRTNLLTYSEQFDNAAWTKVAASISANAVTAPDGATTADKLVEDSTNAAHLVQRSNSVTSGTAYTYSVFAKAGERTRIRVSGGAAAFGANDAIFVLSNGTTTGVSGCTATIQSVGNGWYRCIWTATATATTTPNFFIYLDNGSTTSYQGDGTSGAYIWGAQLEAGAFATSYIPTTTAQVTRIADSATMTGTNFSSWYNATEGTLFAEAAAYRGGGATQRRIFVVDDGTANNRMTLRFDITPTNVAFTDNVSGVLVGNITSASTVVADTFYKNAGAYKLDDFAFGLSGTLVGTDTSAAVPAVNAARIGCSSTGEQINGWIKRISYYPRRLTNSELQAITS
jgi:hypothetical protein